MIPGYFLWGPTALLVAYIAELERRYWQKLSVKRQNCHQLVSSYIVLLASVLMPLTFLAQVILLYPIFRASNLKYFWLPAVILLFYVQFRYADVFVKLFDELRVNWERFSFLKMKLLDKELFGKFTQFKCELQEEIIRAVEKLGPEMIDNFEERRIISAATLSAKE
jgi:hypothetical protein